LNERRLKRWSLICLPRDGSVLLYPTTLAFYYHPQNYKVSPQPGVSGTHHEGGWFVFPEDNLRNAAKSRVRADGRQALLVYLEKDLILQLKKAALDRNCHAYEIVEAATQKWLLENKDPVTAISRDRRDI